MKEEEDTKRNVVRGKREAYWVVIGKEEEEEEGCMEEMDKKKEGI